MNQEQRRTVRTFARSPTAGQAATHRISPRPNGWLRRMQSPYPPAAPRPQAQAVITGSRRLLRGHDAPAGRQVAHKYGAPPPGSVPSGYHPSASGSSAPWPPTQLSPPRASPPAPGCTAGRRPGRYVVRARVLACYAVRGPW